MTKINLLSIQIERKLQERFPQYLFRVEFKTERAIAMRISVIEYNENIHDRIIVEQLMHIYQNENPIDSEQIVGWVENHFERKARGKK